MEIVISTLAKKRLRGERQVEITTQETLWGIQVDKSWKQEGTLEYVSFRANVSTHLHTIGGGNTVFKDLEPREPAEGVSQRNYAFKTRFAE